MGINPISFLTIFGMAIVTYLTRVGGFFIVNKMTISKRTEAFLKAIPGAILISIVAPALFNGGVRETFAGIVTMGVALKTKNLLLAMITGVAIVFIFRNFL